MTKRIVLILLLFTAAGVAVWAAIRFVRPRLHGHGTDESSSLASQSPAETWELAVEKVKADRGEPAGTGARVETPLELRHYSDRHWFLATQVAEIAKYNVHTCQDYMDLAATIERGEMVTVPALTETYILFGIGERADEEAFSRYADDRSIGLYNESQLSDAYKQLDQKRFRLQSEIASARSEAGKLKKRERSRQRELQKRIAALEAELGSTNAEKKQLDEVYGDPKSRQQMFREYESLQTLAKNFAGRTFDLNNAADRQALKISVLSSLRPQALKVLEEVAAAYHHQFGRRLPVSSLVRPEQYQRALRRVNRNAILIDTPPHSTGLAFDIDYRYMSAAEQSFVMEELARLEREGRIEAIRERNANYHVFAFINGTRPSDDLVAASLEKAGAPQEQAHHATAKPAHSRSNKVTKKTAKSRRSRATMRPKRRRR